VITEKDLQEAIAECQGVRNPNASTCIKLAAFLTIQRELYGEKDHPVIEEVPQYSFDTGKPDTVSYYSDTEFAGLIEGKDANTMWAIVDELMSTLQVIEPRLYAAVIRKVRS